MGIKRVVVVVDGKRWRGGTKGGGGGDGTGRVAWGGAWAAGGGTSSNSGVGVNRFRRVGRLAGIEQQE